MAPKLTMSELIHEVGTWSKFNYAEKQAPLFGVVEEIGEACHCILKNIQGIRGYDDVGKFHKDLQDAMADAMIYLCNFAYNHNAIFAFNRNQLDVPQPKDRDANIVLSHILQATSSMLNHEALYQTKNMQQDNAIYSVFCQRFCSAMEIWAAMYFIDLENITFATWAEIVRKRDWKKDTLEGGGHKH
jgi:hypothetical protein